MAADAGFEGLGAFTLAALRGARFTSCSSDGILAIAFSLTSDTMSHILISELINFNAPMPWINRQRLNPTG
ncbi:hypothetical protein [Paraburkholderia caffeinilytica]|uniref:hypothetical protein n=1 Tax=Paraburkholderia caffeinilytica TaxID=1761016 RepID=UPI003DA156A8